VKINEFISSPSNPESNLLTALQLIRNRYKDRQTMPRISTKALINLVLNTDRTFDYDALASAAENNPAVKNLIKSFNKEFVKLRPAGELGAEEETTTITPQDDVTQEPVDTVSDMAKRAAKERGAAV